MRADGTSGRASARIAAIILAAGTLAACSTAAATGGGTAAQGTSGGPVAVTSTGRVQGKVAGTTDEFLGIPYAAPPVGALRWAPPQPAAHWSGIRPATSFAPHCPQSASPFGLASTSEDCLFLNVFRPANGPARPGRSWCGSTAARWSPGRATATTRRTWSGSGVVVVTINYRLGALGFLADRRAGGPAGRARGQLRADGPAGRAALGAPQHRAGSAATRTT